MTFLKRHWLIILALFILILLLNLFLLKDFFGYGLVNEDWIFIIPYKSIKANFFLKFPIFWHSIGARGGYYIFYLGLLDSIFPNNYEMIQKINFFWKILATLSLFPAIWILTRNKTVAFFATFFYAISHSAAGFLTYASTGVEYIGVIFINLLAISYYYFLKFKKTRYFILAFVCLYAALLTAFLRVFPILFIIAALEIFLVWKKRLSYLEAIIHSIILIVPAILMLYFTQSGPMTRVSVYENTVKPVLAGNLYLLQSLLSGIGFQLVSPSYKNLFGSWDMVSFGSYLKVIFPWLYLLMIIIASGVARLISQNSRKFTILVLSIETPFLLILYFLMTLHLHIDPQLVIVHEPGSWEPSFFASLVGSLIFSIALISGWGWFKGGRKNLTQLLIFISPLFSILFIASSFILLGKHFGFDDGVQRYLPVSAIGISVFLATLVSAGLQNKTGKKSASSLNIVLIGSIIIYLILTSQKELNHFFTYYKATGLNLQDQKYVQDQFFNKYLKDRGNLLFYFENRSEAPEDIYWQMVFDYSHLPDWIYLRRFYKLSPGQDITECNVNIANYKNLKNITKIAGNILTFETNNTRCGEDVLNFLGGRQSEIAKRVFTENQLFAFTIQNGNIIDITSEVLNRLAVDLKTPQ